MKTVEKFGFSIIILLMLIIIVPNIAPTETMVGIYPLHDIFLLILMGVGILGVGGILFINKPDFSTSKKRFRRYYKPHSDLTRLSQYIKERLDAGDSNSKIKRILQNVGWDDELIHHAFKLSDKAKIITLKPLRKTKKK